ncbi:hypothetical protein JCM17961_08200 [Endothiovibrio diazotrophicus]
MRHFLLTKRVVKNTTAGRGGIANAETGNALPKAPAREIVDLRPIDHDEIRVEVNILFRRFHALGAQVGADANRLYAMEQALLALLLEAARVRNLRSVE